MTDSDVRRCPKCGFVMCQQFDSKPITPLATLAIPNGKFICYHCKDTDNITPKDKQ